VYEKFDVIKFLNTFKEAQTYAKENKKSLIIVGGTSFYLKVLTQGISQMPPVTQEVKKEVEELLQNLKEAYNLLKSVDLEYSKSISSSDRYRIEKALTIYKATNQPPSQYFKEHKPKPILKELPIYEIKVDRAILRERITLRTVKMLKIGLIDEVAKLEHKYGRASQSMGAIGIKEVLDYFDGIYSKKELKEKIITNTAHLAKRQVTFNKSQLDIKFSGSSEEIKALL